LQVDLVKQKIQKAFPGINVEVIARNSRGDALPEIPLHTVEGSDFFTQEIFSALQSGEADIAVHSLKDMSSDHFFGKNIFAVVDRDDTRDVAIFNGDIEEKICSGEPIIVGTCSPRREEMATVFLKQALPQLKSPLQIITKPIRGNVETRLEKLSMGIYDATILATAGLNRLLGSPEIKGQVQKLLIGKKFMLLPLIDCVPAPCQGAIVAEANPNNKKAVEILKKINNDTLFSNCSAEKKEASGYGTGCVQKFGVTTIQTRNEKYLYAAGRDSGNTEFVQWCSLPELNFKNLFSSTDVMKYFFEYEWKHVTIGREHQIVFVANAKAIQNNPGLLNDKTVLASGTRTWFELAKKGIWVTACADGLGFEFLLPALAMPLFAIKESGITILTHDVAALRWKQKGYNAIGCYRLRSAENKEIQNAIAAADTVFWSSFSQFEFYGKYAKTGTKHVCPGGETAELLTKANTEPVLFPTIKAFEQWRRSTIRSHYAA